MAEERLNLSVYDQIMLHINSGHNFLLSGGAGSGKTYSLVETIRGTIQNYPSKRIACITYTNNAVKEIENRVNHGNLRVSTIHDFLWDNIKSFQKEIKESLPIIINSEEYRTKIKDVVDCPKDYFRMMDKVEYKEHLQLASGVISHDEVLELAHYMFANYPKLCDIVRSRYPFIFIDEYQDTSSLVVNILLESLAKSDEDAHPNCLIGFFGDAMQAIYDNGIGDIKSYLQTNGGNVYEVQKQLNRRNPQLIIDLANKIRTDDLMQVPSPDISAPNMEEDGSIRTGNITFLYSVNEIPYTQVREYVINTFGWNFSDTNNIKELNLTHNMIADKGGFDNLMEIFNGDKILDYCRAIKESIKIWLNEIDTEGKTLGEVIMWIEENKGKDSLKRPTPAQDDYIKNHQDLWDLALATPYDKITNMYVDQDQLIDDKKDDDESTSVSSKRAVIIKHLFKIEEIIKLYYSNKIGAFIKLTDIDAIHSIEERQSVFEKMEELRNNAGITLKELIEKADKLGLLLIDDKLRNYIEKYSYVYHRISGISYEEFKRYYEYMEGNTPFSTQHKTKGSEYDNVLVLMQSKWNKYNFSYLMGESPKKRTASYDSVVNRTAKLFYVCCTRAKRHLIVYYSQPSDIVLAKAKEWFGDANVINI